MKQQIMLVLLGDLVMLDAASAQQPGYVGRWANEAFWCRNKLGSTYKIPIRFSARGMPAQTMVHCR